MQTKNVKHILGTGEEQNYVRLYAESGMGITSDNGNTIWNCVDVDPETVDQWVEIPYNPDDATEEDYQNALVQMGVDIHEEN